MKPGRTAFPTLNRRAHAFVPGPHRRPPRRLCAGALGPLSLRNYLRMRHIGRLAGGAALPPSAGTRGNGPNRNQPRRAACRPCT